jgi:crotonobetainyl-CoA:carnitine CoA-transferase CaiB-like acyl-CoA transferase
MPGSAFGDRDAQARVRHGPPAVGEHSREILAGLGLAPAEIDALIASGAVRQRKESGK